MGSLSSGSIVSWQSVVTITSTSYLPTNTAEAASLVDLLRKSTLARQYPDFPNDFIPPGLFDPNYVPPFHGQVIVVVGIVFTTLMLCTVAARLFVRATWRKKWGWDDTLVIPAAGLTTILGILAIVQVYFGGSGKHSYDLTWSVLLIGFKLQFTQLLIYIWATVMTKMSILCFYSRLLSGTDLAYMRAILCIQIFSFVLGLLSTFLAFFTCNPMRASWDLDARLLPYTSMNAAAVFTSLSALYAVSDIITLVLPMPLVWRMKLSLRKRCTIIWLFSLGGISCAAIIVRSVYIYDIFKTYDPQWRGTTVLVCNQIELTVGIVCASLPALSGVVFETVSKIWDAWMSKWENARSNRGTLVDSAKLDAPVNACFKGEPAMMPTQSADEKQDRANFLDSAKPASQHEVSGRSREHDCEKNGSQLQNPIRNGRAGA